MRALLHKSNVYEMNVSGMDIDISFYIPSAMTITTQSIFCKMEEQAVKEFYCFRNVLARSHNSKGKRAFDLSIERIEYKTNICNSINLNVILLEVLVLGTDLIRNFIEDLLTIS